MAASIYLYFRPKHHNGQTLSKGVLILRSWKTSVLQYSRERRSRIALEQYKEIIAQLIGNGAVDDEPQSDSFPLVNTDVDRPNVDGLTPKENNELRGVLRPSSTIEGRTGPHGALQIQADNFQDSINETQQQLDATEQFELHQRIVVLEEAWDRTPEQRQLEEARELQEEDVSRLQRFKEWQKKTWRWHRR